MSSSAQKKYSDIELTIGTGGNGDVKIRWTGSNGGRVLGSPNLGKSTLAETIAKEAKKQMPDLRVVIISVSGRFDYELGFNYKFISPIRHREELLKYLKDMLHEMCTMMNKMEDLNTKHCRDVVDFFPELLIIDEHESVEEVLDKADRQIFTQAISMRINCGRKIERVTWCLTQSQVLDALQTKTRSLEYLFLGRP